MSAVTAKLAFPLEKHCVFSYKWYNLAFHHYRYLYRIMNDISLSYKKKIIIMKKLTVAGDKARIITV